MAGYKGPAGVTLTEDEWYIVYLMLLSSTTPAVRSIRGRIHEYLQAHDHPGLHNADDGQAENRT